MKSFRVGEFRGKYRVCLEIVLNIKLCVFSLLPAFSCPSLDLSFCRGIVAPFSVRVQPSTADADAGWIAWTTEFSRTSCLCVRACVRVRSFIYIYIYIRKCAYISISGAVSDNHLCCHWLLIGRYRQIAPDTCSFKSSSIANARLKTKQKAATRNGRLLLLYFVQLL